MAAMEEEEEEEGSLLWAALQPPQGRQAGCQAEGDAGLQPVTVQTLMLQKLILQSSTLRTPLCPRIPQPGRLAV